MNSSRKDSRKSQRTTWIERPIAFSGELAFSVENSLEVARAKSNWSFLPLIRLWSWGINRDELVEWFDSIPHEIVFILQQILSKLHTALAARASLTNTTRSFNTNQITDGSIPFDNPFRAVENSKLIGDSFEEYGVAFTQIDYDSSTQERKSAHTNKTSAFIEHMHCEEYLARMANHDLCIPMPPFDFLCFLMDGLLRFSEQRIERTFRLCNFNNESGGAMFVQGVTIRSYDAGGLISKVSALLGMACSS